MYGGRPAFYVRPRGGSQAGFFGAGSRASKSRLDKLFQLHAVAMFVIGCLAFLKPQWLVYLLHHASDGYHTGKEGGPIRMAFIVMRVFAGFLLAQAYIIYVLITAVNEPYLRRAWVQSSFAAFLLTTLTLVRAQLTEDTPSRTSNWLIIMLFGALTLGYAWFAFVERIKVFEGLDKVLS